MIEQLGRTAVASLLGLPRPLLSLLAARPVVGGEEPLDVQLQLLLKLAEAVESAPVETLSPQHARRLLARSARLACGRPPSMARVEDRRVPGPAGQIPLRIYVPRSGTAPGPVLVYYHGGGWVTGSPDTHDALARRLADRGGCIVVSVDYRLAPEHRFPAAVEDAIAAFLWAAAHAPSFGGDGSRVAVGGDSAGGNLAAVVAQQTHAAAQRTPSFQLLVYPVTDLAEESPSYQLFADGFYLTRAAMRWFRGHYLGDLAAAADPRVSPLRAPSLAGLAPAMVITAGFDPLRDEGRAYAERLLAAGVAIDYRNYPTLIHGFLSMAGIVGAADRALADAARALRNAFGTVP